MMSFVASLVDAVELVRRSNQPNAGVVIDALHLNQSGGTPADVMRVDPALIGSAQVCDGPLKPMIAQYYYNALNERQIPGKGELPLVELLAALPSGVTVGIEVPLKSLDVALRRPAG
jgi:sugar phosphate isomerase/epimerase